MEKGELKDENGVLPKLLKTDDLNVFLLCAVNKRTK